MQDQALNSNMQKGNSKKFFERKEAIFDPYDRLIPYFL